MSSKGIDPRIYGVEDSLKDVKRIVAVGSGKGGVGKSTISTFLSLVLSDNGFNVGLLDLDLFGPSTHLILNAKEAKPNEYYGLRPVEIDGYTVPEVLRSGNHAKIDEYRQFHSIEKTMKNRMDLFEKKLENIDEDVEFKKVYKKYLKSK